MNRFLARCIFSILALASSLYAQEDEEIKIPVRRTMNATLNAAALLAAGLEARFQWGFSEYLSLIVPVSFQKEPEFIWPSFTKGRSSAFDITRFHAGVGIRWHLSEPTGISGWYLEPSARVGMTWFSAEKGLFSAIPTLLLGYMSIWENGYTVSFGGGLEYELLFGKNYYSDFLATAFVPAIPITKLPLTGELSFGYSW